MTCILFAMMLGADPLILEIESRRIATIERFTPAVAAVFDASGAGGGSGVVVSPDGYVITNFHVSGMGPALKVGLKDGKLYDAVICGIDPVGDVAVIKMLGRTDFPFAPLGDSDDLHVGDSVLAAGNPFLLATNFDPTVTFGIVSGLRRYQYPAGTILEYADCIQTDAAINPGNSGGPLFNLAGQVVGINGRGSFEKRGRVSVGVGYAISINQIKRFFEALRGGMLVDHATLGATVVANEIGIVVVDQILTTSDAYRLGLRPDDEIIRFGDRAIGSVNQFKNVLAVYPRGWRVPLVFRSKGVEKLIRPRLLGNHAPGELEKKLTPPKPATPLPIPLPGAPKMPAAVARVYKSSDGFINYHFNSERQRTLLGLSTPKLEGRWRIHGTTERGKVIATIADDVVAWQSGPNRFGYLVGEELTADPPGTNGLLVALHQWRRMSQKRAGGFTSLKYVGSMATSDDRILPTLETVSGGVVCRWFFDEKDGRLAGFESQAHLEYGPCEIHFSKETTGPDNIPKVWRIFADGNHVLTFSVDRLEPNS